MSWVRMLLLFSNLLSDTENRLTLFPVLSILLCCIFSSSHLFVSCYWIVKYFINQLTQSGMFKGEKCSTILKFVNPSVWDFVLLWSPILIPLFKLSWLVLINHMRPHLWRIGFCHFPILLHVTVNSVKFFLSLSEIESLWA